MVSNQQVIDLRSDTVTKPSPAMRQVIAEAEVGDDVYGEDPSINELQHQTAFLLGKESALFVPSGTMANLISVMTHCSGRGQEVLLGDKSHLFLCEQGGLAQIGGINPFPLINKPDGTFDLQELERKIRKDDPHYPVSKLVCLENTHSFCGGRVLSPNFIKQVSEKAKEYNLAVHCDGARLMNAAVALKIPPSHLVEHCDSVSMCFSKGLGAPVGSILAGTAKFINRATRIRKVLGGGMRQCGLLAAAALYSLNNMVNRLEEDHNNAKKLAEVIYSINSPYVKVDEPQTNMLLIQLDQSKINANNFCQRMKNVTEKEKQDLGFSAAVLLSGVHSNVVRVVTHVDVSSEDINLTAEKFKYVVNEYDL